MEYIAKIKGIGKKFTKPIPINIRRIYLICYFSLFRVVFRAINLRNMTMSFHAGI